MFELIISKILLKKINNCYNIYKKNFILYTYIIYVYYIMQEFYLLNK